MRRRADARPSARTAPPIWWDGSPAAVTAAAPPSSAPAAPEQSLPWLTPTPAAVAAAFPAGERHLEPAPAGPPLTPLPAGQWLPATTGADGAGELWVPVGRSAATAPPAVAAPVAPLARHAPGLGGEPSPAIPTRVRPSDAPSSTGQPRPNVERSFAAVEPVDPAEAAQLATTFSMDYLSWDEQQPWRRSEVLRRYLPAGADTTLGWSGEGRQRAEFACPGQVRFVEFCLWVDVRVRLTPYRRTGEDPEPACEARLPDGAVWSSAPAPLAGGWEPGASAWMRLAVPVRRHDCGGLVVDLCTIPEPDPNEGHQQ